jgi:hypothetical protein
MTIELVTTDGLFSLDGEDFQVTNNIWIVTLPPETVVHTGHGDSTTIGAETERIHDLWAELQRRA